MQIVEWVSAIAASLTFLALIWYTIETQKLRRAAEKQNRLATIPIIVLSLSPLKEVFLGGQMVLCPPNLRNVGTGPAFDINVTPFGDAALEVRFAPVSLLEPKETKNLDFTIWEGGTPGGFSKTMALLEHLFETGRFAEQMAVSVAYSDFSGKRYRSNHVVQFNPKAKTVTTAFKDHEDR